MMYWKQVMESHLMNATLSVTILSVFFLSGILATHAFALTEDLGNGFRHHGVATPISNHRGIVATVDGNGHNIVLVWLFDHRGGYALLLIDTETGKSEEYPVPFPPGGDCPYASLLSSRNQFYTHFNSHFVAFDPVQRKFVFCRETAPQMAMGMTEDDKGRIWSVTYPSSGVVCYDPETNEFRDYGHVYKENWQQYQRYVATDDKGWLYFGIGYTASQIIALNPETGEAVPILAESDRIHGSGYVVRDVNGKVYAHTGNEEKWLELYEGKASPITKPSLINKKAIITGSQELFFTEWPNGKRIKTCDLVDKTVVIEDPVNQTLQTVTFDYTSEGAHIMGIAVAPDGTVCGGTAFPMRFFSYTPETDKWINRESYGQWNTVVSQGNRFFVGGYPGGFLLEWDPSKDWFPTRKDDETSNPRFLKQCSPTIYRPHELIACPDGETVVLGGTPDYGSTGGGLFFWNSTLQEGVLLDNTELIPDQSVMSMVALDADRIIGGTTTAAGTGGEKKAKEAELFLLDMKTRKIEWHDALIPGIQEYTDLTTAPDGTVYGIADRRIFFHFEPKDKRLLAQQNLEAEFGVTNSQQGPRVFVKDAKGNTFVLFVKGVALIEPRTHTVKMIAESPVPIGPGGDYLNGRIYFGSGSHLYSYEVPSISAE